MNQEGAGLPQKYVVLPSLGEEGEVLHLVDAGRQNRAALEAIKRDNGAIVSR